MSTSTQSIYAKWVSPWGSALNWQLLLRGSTLFYLLTALALLAVWFLQQKVIPSKVDRIARQQSQEMRLRAELARPIEVVKPDVVANSAVQRLAAFEKLVLSPTQLPERLRQIYAVAQEQKLVIKQAEYRWQPQQGARFSTYEMVMPLQGNYSQIRSFMERCLVTMPDLALREVAFKRDGIGQAQTEVRVRLAMLVKPKLADLAEPTVTATPAVPPAVEVKP
jgi:hypothetical protein